MKKDILHEIDTTYPILQRYDFWGDMTALLCGILLSHLGIIAPPHFADRSPLLFLIEFLTMLAAGLGSIYCANTVAELKEKLETIDNIPEH